MPPSKLAPRLPTVVACFGLLLVGLLASAALAAFPGANGKIAFVSSRDGNSEIYVMNADGSGQTKLTNNTASDSRPAFAPGWTEDRLRVQPRRQQRDLRDERRRLGSDQADQQRGLRLFPAWSPDGSKIAFESGRDGNLEIYVMNADGSGQTRLTNNASTRHYARLVAGWFQDRLREQSRWKRRDLRDERRRLGPDEADQ